MITTRKTEAYDDSSGRAHATLSDAIKAERLIQLLKLNIAWEGITPDRIVDNARAIVSALTIRVDGGLLEEQ